MINKMNLAAHFRKTIQKPLPLAAEKHYAQRLQQLFELGRCDLSLAKLAEAHYDALAILSEAGRPIPDNTAYAVWAAEMPGKSLIIKKYDDHWTLTGTKPFCSGAGLVDRALVSADGWLIDIDLTDRALNQVQFNYDGWCTQAFQATNTARVTFNALTFDHNNIINDQGWYLGRLGFWQGALGPAACWGGGAAGLVDYAYQHVRNDPHSTAHVAAMCANNWAIQALLETAGREIDTTLQTSAQAQSLALKVRHLVEQLCTDTLRRFARAYGPFPLACDSDISRRYQELDLFLRQCHAERDLDTLGVLIRQNDQIT